MDYNRIIKSIQAAAKRLHLECSDNRMYDNQGTLLFTTRDTFAPIIAVSWSAQDAYGSFAYFVGTGINHLSPPGCGCKPTGAIRQESFKLSEVDEAISNLLTYVRLAKACKIDRIAKGYMHLCWTLDQCRAGDADPSPYKKRMK